MCVCYINLLTQSLSHCEHGRQAQAVRDKLTVHTCVHVLYFRSLLFHPDAACLYSFASGFLNVYNWEPVKLYQSLDLSNVCKSSDISESARVSDLAISQRQLVC